MRALALNTGSDFHLLDHIAPLAELLKIPLLTTEELNFSLAKRFYPQVKIEYMPDLEFRLKELADSYDMLFECKYWRPHLKQLFRQLYNKEMRLVFCPYGQSDKGFNFPILAPYSAQDAVLIYGSLMLEMLNTLKIPLQEHAVIGNYRLPFYKKHRNFYDELLEKTIQLDPKKRTVLYAPTWKDADETSSFFDYGAKILRELPNDWNLIVKVHPLLEQRNPVEYDRILLFLEKKPNAFLLHEFPPVYPVLSIADIYIGDFSSVGYDFLEFERPLFLLPAERPTKLYSCGTTLDLSKNIYSQLEKPKDFKREQKTLKKFAFSQSPEDIFTQLGVR